MTTDDSRATEDAFDAVPHQATTDESTAEGPAATQAADEITDPSRDGFSGAQGAGEHVSADPAPQPGSGETPPNDAGEIATGSIIEAVLFATESPLPPAKIAQIIGFGDARVVKKQIAALNERYQGASAAFRIEELAGGFQMLTLPAYHKWVSRLHSVRRETKLSPAALETLAVVAYKQPALRADVESVRGVAVGDILNRLREMGLIKIVGRAEVIGRPMLYGTTRRFLEVFGLASLDDLPQVEALPPPRQTDQPPDGKPSSDDPTANGAEADLGLSRPSEPSR